MQTCPSCGEENPDRFRICGMCGAELAPQTLPQDVRKTVTIVFSDLKGSTSLGERLDTESLREVLSHYFAEMKAVLERHGGTVEKYIGDAIMAVFGLPVLHEDDAMRAVRAAAEMRETLAAVNERLQQTHGVMLENRTGVNTGEVVAGDVTHGQRLVTGDAVNVAARLEQNAPAMEVLVGESTYRLVKDAVQVEPVEPLELKGKAEPMPAYLLISATHEEGVARRLDAPIVGREHEIGILADALRQAIEHKDARIVSVVAPAGVGKSRLLRELVQRSADIATALRGRCLPYGEGITFWPLGEITREAAGIDNDDSLESAQTKLAALLGDDTEDIAERIAAAIGLSPVTYPVHETFWATRRFFEILARRQPLIVIFDDIHWAEQTLLDLILYVVDSIEDAPVVVACSTRPDLFEEHPDWAEARPSWSTVILEPLSEEESAQVVENLLGSAALDARARDRIIEAAEGNPLFVEQMLSMLIDDGILSRDVQGRWTLTSDLGSITIPPTINALLSARLDRLGVIERSVIERGAVIGQVFFRGAVEDLAPETVQPHVGESLDTLTRKELIRHHESTFAGQDAFRFVHILIRDAAYQGLLKRERAGLHERFVDWLEQVSQDRITEFEEIRGYHLEQAYLIVTELAPADDHAIGVGRRASGYLSSAGRRALARGDMPAAANLLDRAAAVLPGDDPLRPRLLASAGEALIETGEFDKARLTLDTAVSVASDLRDRPSEIAARIVGLNLYLYTPDHEGTQGKIVEEVEAAIPVLEELRDHVGLARAWQLLGSVHLALCRYRTAEEAVRHTLEHAGLAGDELLQARELPKLTFCALFGPTPVPEAIAVCEEVLDRVHGDRKAEALANSSLAHIEAMRGNFERARELYPGSRAALEELGWNFQAALVSLDSGPIEMLAGDPVAAERELRRDYEALERMGDTSFLPTTGGYLAEALYQQGRLDDAERLTHKHEDTAVAEDVISQTLWRSVRGKVLACRGETATGEELVREAVELIRRSEDVYSQANALMDLGEVLVSAGKPVDARAALTEALELYEQKGNFVSAVSARDRLAALNPEDGGPSGARLPAEPRSST